MLPSAQTTVCRKKVADVFGYILQVLVLAAIIAYVVSLITDIGVKSNTLLVILIIVYILYVICEFCSSIASFLCHKTDENGIRNIMQVLVKTPPTIDFWCECYHYETRVVRVRAPPKKGGKKGGGGGPKKGPSHSGGGGHGGARKGPSHSGGGGGGPKYKTETRRIVTWQENVFFPYYSARDVSGLFEIQDDRKSAMGKAYVKLEILPEINFADSITYWDYENFRTHFYNRNRIRDQYMDYRETRAVPGLNPLNFIRIRDTEPCGVNICMFIIFTILPFAEFYKCYVNSFCLNQSFKIRKLISTRYDLNQDQYNYFVPSFNIPAGQQAFDASYYNYINNDYELKKPTNEELSQAAAYQDKIPKYECVSYTSIKGDIKVGVVQDLDPGYCSKNINDAPPPNCQDVYEGQQPNGNDMNMNNMNMNMNMNVNVNQNQNNYGQQIDSRGNMNQDGGEQSSEFES